MLGSNYSVDVEGRALGIVADQQHLRDNDLVK